MGKIYAYSHPGYSYEENQDSFLIFPEAEAALLAVADGLGGHHCGKKASEKALERLAKDFHYQNLAAEEVTKLLAAANTEVYNLEPEGERKPATTLSLVWLQGESFFIGHVGDSRIYLYENGHLNLLTEDQSALAELAQQGQWVPERYYRRFGHILARVLGTRPDLSWSEDIFSYVLGPFTLPRDGWLLLTTDGLTKHFSQTELEGFFQQYNEQSPKFLAEFLVNGALALGGKDNLTVIVKKIEGGR